MDVFLGFFCFLVSKVKISSLLIQILHTSQVKNVIEEFLKVIYALFVGKLTYVKIILPFIVIIIKLIRLLFFTLAIILDLDFTFLEMNPFALVDGKPYPLDMRGELDDTAAFKNFKK